MTIELRQKALELAVSAGETDVVAAARTYLDFLVAKSDNRELHRGTQRRYQEDTSGPPAACSQFHKKTIDGES